MRVLIVFLFAIMFNNCLTQVNINFQNTIGGIGEDYASGINYIPGSNSYLLFGHSISEISGDKTSGVVNDFDIWLVLTDSVGNIKWNKTYGSYGGDVPYDCVLKGDILFVLCKAEGGVYGDKMEPGYGGNDLWLLAVNAQTGNLLWEKSYGGNNEDVGGLSLAYAKILHSNGVLTIASSSSSDISGNKTVASKGGYDYWILQVDTEDGSVLNQNAIGSSGNDYLTDIKLDGSNFYLAGVSEYGQSGDKSELGYGVYDYWIVILDHNLQVIENKVYGGDITESEPRITIINDALYLSGNSRSGASGNKTTESFGGYSDVWMLKLNKNNLSKIWEKSFGGVAYDRAYISFYDSEKELLVLGGMTNTSNSGTVDFQCYALEDGWIFYLDTNGNVIDQYNYGGTGQEKVVGICKNMTNNSLSLALSSNSNQDGNKDEVSQGGYDYWLVNLDQSGLNLSISESYEHQVNIFPIPSNGEINVVIDEKSELRLYDLNGKLLDLIQLERGTNKINVEDDNIGIIIYQLITEGKQIREGKIVVF